VILSGTLCVVYLLLMLRPVSISENALKEIRNILKNKGIPVDYGLRVTVRGAGCGVALKLGFDHLKEGDLEYYVDDVRVVIQKKETLFMVGKRIEFYDETDGRGFMFVDEPIPQP
jgi:iron-sulfur cluster assembly protein